MPPSLGLVRSLSSSSMFLYVSLNCLVARDYLLGCMYLLVLLFQSRGLKRRGDSSQAPSKNGSGCVWRNEWNWTQKHSLYGVETNVSPTYASSSAIFRGLHWSQTFNKPNVNSFHGSLAVKKGLLRNARVWTGARPLVDSAVHVYMSVHQKPRQHFPPFLSFRLGSFLAPWLCQVVVSVASFLVPDMATAEALGATPQASMSSHAVATCYSPPYLNTLATEIQQVLTWPSDHYSALVLLDLDLAEIPRNWLGLPRPIQKYYMVHLYKQRPESFRAATQKTG